MAKIKKKIASRCQEYGEIRTLIYCSWEGNITELLWKVVVSCLKNVNHTLAMLPSISTSRYLPNKNEN